jgi:c-di-GMP-binding flagellar brake protein YcgR
LLLFLPVLNVENDEILGYIADISDEGILVFSPTPIELDQTFSLVIRLEDLKEASLEENLSDEHIQFKARSRWIDADVKPFFNRTGLEFVDISQEAHNIITNITRNVADNLAWNKVPHE